MERRKDDLETDLNRSQVEDCKLKKLLTKLEQLNEDLGQDKVDFNNIVIKVCHQ